MFEWSEDLFNPCDVSYGISDERWHLILAHCWSNEWSRSHRCVVCCLTVGIETHEHLVSFYRAPSQADRQPPSLFSNPLSGELHQASTTESLVAQLDLVRPTVQWRSCNVLQRLRHLFPSIKSSCGDSSRGLNAPHSVKLQWWMFSLPPPNKSLQDALTGILMRLGVCWLNTITNITLNNHSNEWTNASDTSAGELKAPSGWSSSSGELWKGEHWWRPAQPRDTG